MTDPRRFAYHRSGSGIHRRTRGADRKRRRQYDQQALRKSREDEL